MKDNTCVFVWEWLLFCALGVSGLWPSALFLCPHPAKVSLGVLSCLSSSICAESKVLCRLCLIRFQSLPFLESIQLVSKLYPLSLGTLLLSRQICSL